MTVNTEFRLNRFLRFLEKNTESVFDELKVASQFLSPGDTRKINIKKQLRIQRVLQCRDLCLLQIKWMLLSMIVTMSLK